MRHDDHIKVASEYMRKADDQLKLAKELFDITRLANRALCRRPLAGGSGGLQATSEEGAY
jgi:hypothetical protein|tara:strand:- start:679 stop:858 length:180 start_codon:yes stop_codon:yes gene_type:complete